MPVDPYFHVVGGHPALRTHPKGDTHVPPLRDAIYATKDFAGITGTLTCTPTGDCGAPVIGVYQVTQENVDKLEMPGVAIWP